jgi:hypothetical protein
MAFLGKNIPDFSAVQRRREFPDVSGISQSEEKAGPGGGKSGADRLDLYWF